MAWLGIGSVYSCDKSFIFVRIVLALPYLSIVSPCAWGTESDLERHSTK